MDEERVIKGVCIGAIVIFTWLLIICTLDMYFCYQKHGVLSCKAIEGNGQIVIK